MIEASSAATTELKRIAELENKPARVRIALRGGGCSGYTVTMDFTALPADENFDLLFEIEGVEFVVDEKSGFFLQGAKLDYGGGLLDRGFKWEFPKAKGGCGCGTSFSF